MTTRFNLSSFLTVAIALLIVVQVSGCASTPPPPTSINADVVAAADANSGTSGLALPIVVRVYELKGLGNFEAADFFAIYNQEQEALGADLLAREEVNLRPGFQRNITRPTDPGAHYIGVIGAFKEIDSASWRAVYSLKPNAENAVMIKVDANAVWIGKR